MALWKRKPKESRTDGAPAPEWASCLRSKLATERFEALVAAYFKSRGERAELGDGRVWLAGQRDEAQYGLTGVAQQCAQRPEKEWARLIAAHFTRLIDGGAKDAAIEESIGDFEAVRARLVLRLWDEENEDARRVPTVRREVGPGLAAVLCLDLPESIRTVGPEEAAAWDRSEESLFDEALDNVERLSKARVEPVELGNGTTLMTVGGSSCYISALAMRLHRFPDLSGTRGAFVAVPKRDALLAVPFSGVAAVKHLSDLMFIAAGVFRDGPGSVTPRVYWVRDGAWTEVPYSIDAKGLKVSPPPELVEALNDLAGGQG